MNHINYNKLVDVSIKGPNLEFKFYTGLTPYFGDPSFTTLSIECPTIVKHLEQFPIMQQVIGELRADKINLDQELRKVKRERDILLNTLGKLSQ